MLTLLYLLEMQETPPLVSFSTTKNMSASEIGSSSTFVTNYFTCQQTIYKTFLCLVIFLLNLKLCFINFKLSNEEIKNWKLSIKANLLLMLKFFQSIYFRIEFAYLIMRCKSYIFKVVKYYRNFVI